MSIRVCIKVRDDVSTTSKSFDWTSDFSAQSLRISNFVVCGIRTFGLRIFYYFQTFCIYMNSGAGALMRTKNFYSVSCIERGSLTQYRTPLEDFPYSGDNFSQIFFVLRLKEINLSNNRIRHFNYDSFSPLYQVCKLFHPFVILILITFSFLLTLTKAYT